MENKAAITIQIWWRNILKFIYEEPTCRSCGEKYPEAFGYCSSCFKYEKRMMRRDRW